MTPEQFNARTRAVHALVSINSASGRSAMEAKPRFRGMYALGPTTPALSLVVPCVDRSRGSNISPTGTGQIYSSGSPSAPAVTVARASVLAHCDPGRAVAMPDLLFGLRVQAETAPEVLNRLSQQQPHVIAFSRGPKSSLQPAALMPFGTQFVCWRA